MRDEHREKLDNRLNPMHLYKLTPRTNCGECGFAACLAFATQVIVGQADIDSCPYLDPEAVRPLREKLAVQHQAGIGVKREGFEKALQFLRGEIQKWDLRAIATSLGATWMEANGKPALKLEYLEKEVLVTTEDITVLTGEELNPYEKILLYNYVLGGASETSGTWVGMESLPNSVSKIKSLRSHCEIPLALAYSGRMSELASSVVPIGRKIDSSEQGADFAAEFRVLPKLPIRIIWWDGDEAEGFEARAKFLFDSRVLETLDLESLLFTCEQIVERLMERSKGH
jgi:hypothetical protein